MQLSLTLNCWPLTRQQQQTQLDQLDQAPVQRIVVGETVCEKRDRPALRTLLETAELAQARGIQVVLASLNLVNGPRELKLVEQVCTQQSLMVEANDLTAAALLSDLGRPFWAGANLNLYNRDSLAWAARLGATGYQPPIDMSEQNMTLLLEAGDDLGLEGEILGFGWPQLAVSARCASARIHGRNKAHCDKVCQQHPVPMASTLEQEPLLWLNGPQNHGVRPVDRLDSVEAWRRAGAHWLRVIPGPWQQGQWLASLTGLRHPQGASRLRREIPVPGHRTATG
ncbi:hypothetical protein FCL40_06045 [Ferrimonas sediminicola]|uniref:Uncharacterized protein n=1 Tax=Ferrimonas sediminicola TaxID=2569538 RepID=A0A4U1BEU3_9GAMM|nr:hypothetical protein [Ferrimonas sediminicola]TKB49718.1 hypothetical protein FCL40_06045 [Ferrimonas sediminicola]